MKYLLLLLLLIYSCTEKKIHINVFEAKEIEINFNVNQILNKNKYINIDNNHYVFSYDFDSIYNLKNTLPGSYMFVKRSDSSFVKEKNSYIFIAMTLYDKLKKTGEYHTDNLPQLLTMGKLNLKRNDGNNIRIVTNCNNIIKKIK